MNEIKLELEKHKKRIKDLELSLPVSSLSNLRKLGGKRKNEFFKFITN